MRSQMTEVIKKISSVAKKKRQTAVHTVTCTESFKNHMNCNMRLDLIKD